MTRYDRKKLIEHLILNGRGQCIKCNKDVSEGFTSVDDILDTVETRKINNMLPRSLKNSSLVHINCITSIARAASQTEAEPSSEVDHIEQILDILAKGPIGGWQSCYVCKESITKMEPDEVPNLKIYRSRKNAPARLVHPQCMDKIDK